MIETALTGVVIALGIGLMVEKSKTADLKGKVKILKRQLCAAQVKGKQDVLATQADAHEDIALLQLQLFQAREEICTLKSKLSQKDKLLRQKWNAAIESQKD